MNITFPVLTIDKIRSYLIGRKEHLAIAESVTAGFLQAAFSTAQEASLFFEGGITAYNINQKVRHLNIDADYAASCNCVSGRTAEEMAAGVSKLFDSQWGVAVTGYASPVKESNFELFAYFSIAHNGKVLRTRRIQLNNQDNTSAQVEYVYHVLEAFAEITGS